MSRVGIFLLIVLCMGSMYSYSAFGQVDNKYKVSHPKVIAIKPFASVEFTPQETPRRGEEKPPEKGRKLGPMEKSFLFPGWGQISEKRYGRGVTFMLAEAVCLSAVVVYTVKGSHSYSDYREADNTPDAIRFRLLTERYDKGRNISLALGAIVWAVNLLDMSLTKRKVQNNLTGDFNKNLRDYNLNVSLTPTGDLQIQFSLLF